MHRAIGAEAAVSVSTRIELDCIGPPSRLGWHRKSGRKSRPYHQPENTSQGSRGIRENGSNSGCVFARRLGAGCLLSSHSDRSQ